VKRPAFLRQAFSVLLVTFLLLPSASLGAAVPAATGASLSGQESLSTVYQVFNTTNWCVAGGFNGWDNSSLPLNDSGLGGDLFAGDGIYSRDQVVSDAGRYEFKVVECGNWDTAFPAQNSWFYTSSAGQAVKFTFDTNDHSGDAGATMFPSANIVNVWGDTLPVSFTAVGDFQGWNNLDPATQLLHEGRGVYRLAYSIPTPGSYIGKVTVTASWDGYGGDGRSIDAWNLAFTTDFPNEIVVFLLDTRTGRLTVTPNNSSSGKWCVAGGFNGWDNGRDALNDSGLSGDLIGGDAVFSLNLTIPNAGRQEWKIVECGNWDNAYPAGNAWLNTTEDGQTVRFTFDTNNRSNDTGLPLLPAQDIVDAWDSLPTAFTAVGDFQGWDPSNPNTVLHDQGNGWHSRPISIPASGSYLGKVSTWGSWDAFGADGRSSDAQNLAFQTFSDSAEVLFVLDAYRGRVAVLAPPPPDDGAGHDNDIWWDFLGHDSRDSLYRTPGGPVPTGTPVIVRLRAADNDLTAARVRVWNDRMDTQMMLDMVRAASDGEYEWWEAVLPASPEPTIYWYRFIAVDGTAVAYYEDHPARDGGWGKTYASSPDSSWQLSVYDPDFQTPDWVKNAVIYQIFPDRFRDGDPSNNPEPGRFFYGELDGTIFRSDPAGGMDNPWNTIICDPRDQNDCPGTYSLNFYGGDLQGVIDKLDYLQDLGATAIYFNPVFLSPSNHKYDTTDFTQIDPDFGDLETFQNLAQQAKNRGMRLILDGVFNHTSSDSIYFDRYGNYETLGACESPDSPYRDWYYFRDVSPGTGACAASDGTPLAAAYESWFGFASLPKLNSHNQAVRDLFWAGGENAVGTYWLEWADGWRLDVAGDVDPGTTNDPTNDYWEGFRLAVKDANPEAYIVGEEWGLAGPWTLGGEWDATMNYQFSSAIKSFWRDIPFIDNDHNPGSSAGPLMPLTPTELDARLHNLAERYPPEAFYAMMNLLGSHDTNRVLFQLDHNAAVGTNPAPLQDPNYDWSEAIDRLKGVVLLQTTLPGAPTIYYGDEVGLVGPVYYHGGKWEDDPYNRQPYPWLDETGTPFYTHLQTQAGQNELLEYHKLLLAARNSHPALRTGSFDTLLADDVNNVYAYGRKMVEHTDAALVVINRSAAGPQPISLDVSGYLPVGAHFTNVLDQNAPYTVDASGSLSVIVPAWGGALLVLAEPMPAPPAAVTDLSVTAERSGELDLAWSPAPGASSYNVYRSLLRGGGYSLVANVSGTTFTDTGLQNSIRYYYVVVSRDDATLLTSSHSNEANGMPKHDLTTAWFNLQWPFEITHTISTTNRTENIYGQLWIGGATGPAGPADGIRAQVGYGPSGSQPGESWTWEEMAYNTSVGNNDEYLGSLLPDALGEYHFTTRYSSDGGATWQYAGRNGPGYTPGEGGLLHVIPSDDADPPAAPENLTVLGTTPGSISLGWNANSEPDLAGYEVFRKLSSTENFSRIARLSAGMTAFVDETATSSETYQYYLLAFDTSFNRSAPSNIVQATAEARLVSVTFNVEVPGFTPGTVYIAGSIPGLPVWNPSATPMNMVSENTWSLSLEILDGTPLQYKFTRGSWEAVEKGADGNEEIPDRQLVVSYGENGSQIVNHVVQNWRDPIVVSHFPASGASGIQADTTISVTWSQAMQLATSFFVQGPDGPVSGSFSYNQSDFKVTFTPEMGLISNAVYSVSVSGQVGITGDGQLVPVQWAFTTGLRYQAQIEQIEEIKEMVDELRRSRVLNTGQARSLIVSLDDAILVLEMEDAERAVEHLEAFINKVEAFVKGRVLTPAQGQSLIVPAEAVIEQLR
jgi:glycosidase